MPIQRKYDFKPGTKISSDQVDEEFNQLVSQVNQVESDLNEKEADIISKAQMLKITKDNGDVKISLSLATDDILASVVGMGRGVHTFYAAGATKNLPPSGISIRGLAHLTANNFGWLWCTDYRNQVWTNYLNNGVWEGWRRLISNQDGQETLWTGAHMPNSNHTLRPTKKLSECRNGWLLIWSDYDPAPTNKANDWDFVFSPPIPKEFISKHNGALCMFSIANFADLNNKDIAVKKLRVYDDRIEGHDDNSGSATTANDVVLRYILEV